MVLHPSDEDLSLGLRYWSTDRVFRWAFGWKVPLREKLV
jgi:hypothetical protein